MEISDYFSVKTATIGKKHRLIKLGLVIIFRDKTSFFL